MKIKRISVNPGHRLSLQKHFHRAENWTVVKGEARITLGDSERICKAHESVFIPVECKHRLENIGDVELELIEVQTGDYLGEDDIVRFADDYARAKES